jgi:vacuolar-type H+-ATPase subunit H
LAIDVLTQIKAAEEQALEIRRVASAAAKDAIKLVKQENNAIKEQALSDARNWYAAAIEAAEKEAKTKLDTLQEQRLRSCEVLKQNAQKKLAYAATVCLERILK